MQYLKMAQKVRQLVGMQGTGPSSVDATGYEALFLSNIKDAWEDLQNYRKKWKWMREDVSFLTQIGVGTYTPSTLFGPSGRFKMWYDYSFFVTIGSTKQPIRFVDYDTFIHKYANQIGNSPIHEFTIRPKDCALVFPNPDKVYTITASYKKSNQELLLATDVPELPLDYHSYIVYEAVSRYALSMSIGHVYQLYSVKASTILGSILRDQNVTDKFNIRGIV